MAKDTLNKKVDSIIDQIVIRRKELGISHEKLATLTNLNRSTISLIENKKRIPTILTLLKICEALDISLGKLIQNIENS